jgi:hypothetical protein
MRLSRSLPLGAMLCAITAAPAAAQVSFEGVITFAMLKDGGGAPDTMIQTSKGNLVKIEVISGSTGKGGGGVYDLEKHTMMIVMPERKMYMTMTMKPMDSLVANAMGKIELTKLGRTETVAGVSCDVYHAKSTDKNGEVKEGEGCFAKGVGLVFGNIFAQGDRKAMQDVPAAIRDLAKHDMHMVKMVSLKDGKPSRTLVAVKIGRHAVDASVFQAPAGYTEMKIPAGMQMP